jgi:signal transduction histidine kinase
VLNRLRSVALFAELPEEDLACLSVGLEEVHVPAGVTLFSEGDAGDRAFVVLDGELEIVKATAGGEMLLAVKTEGIVGEMALLEQAPRNASVRARRDTTLLAIPKAQLDELLATSPNASRALFAVMLDRWRDTQSKLQQTERMAQLGTLTAGLAHELNNPAAAVNRSAGQLGDALGSYGDARARVALAVEHSALAAVQEAMDKVQERRGVSPDLDALTRGDQEERLESWLEEHDVARAWEIAPGLVDAGVGIERLDALAATVDDPEGLQAVVCLIDAVHTLLTLVHQVEEGSRRMSAIVKALKSYSYLDQAPVQDVDVAAGLDDTLLILEHKMKGISVRREYDGDLPLIEALGSELNQVWTNLIDNAVDAVGSSDDPQITVRARRNGSGIAVEVEDNGPGIPEDVRPRIFDAFYTTKPPGQGTGLGLDISQNIVVHHHRGRITVDSVPGRTCFRVELPLRMSDR